MVDVSHLNEAGFWDVAELTQAPIVATHSNAHALCASSRNLTDRQIDAIGESGGVVGINFATMFLREDGRPGTDVAARGDRQAHRLRRVADRRRACRVRVGLRGSRGARTSSAASAGLPRLVDALRAAGHDDASLELITHGNWLRVLGETWRPWGRYFRLAGFDPRATLVDAAERFAEPGLAVDLGAGTGRDTAELIRRGWRVLAIDREAEAIGRLHELVGADGGRLETITARYEQVDWPACDLLNASFALPFCSPSEFPRVWSRIVDSIVPGGRFAGQLFGNRDAWARHGDRRPDAGGGRRAARAVRGRAARGVRGRGVDGDRQDKQWHLFHVVARKR